MPIIRMPLRVALCVGLAGCAGYRGGWESVAYIREPPPPDACRHAAAAAPATQPGLDVPGLVLQVAIDNQQRTHDTQVVLFALPLSIDPRTAYPRNHQPGRTRVFVRVVPMRPGYAFRPALALLEVAGQRYQGRAGFDFDQWDAQGRRVAHGGTWEHRPVGESYALAPGQRHLLSIDFDTPVPSPQSPAIALDLSQALRAEGVPPLPLIRFAPVCWRQGYT